MTGPKKLGTFGASYLYSIFKKLGLIRSTGDQDWPGLKPPEEEYVQLTIADFD